MTDARTEGACVSTVASTLPFPFLDGQTDGQTDSQHIISEAVAPQAVDGALILLPSSELAPQAVDGAVSCMQRSGNQQFKCQRSCKIHNSASLLNISPVPFARVLLVPAWNSTSAKRAPQKPRGLQEWRGLHQHRRKLDIVLSL